MRMGADGYALDAEGTLVQPLLLLKCVGPPPHWFRTGMVKLDPNFLPSALAALINGESL